MSKIVLLLIIGFAAYLLFRLVLRGRRRPPATDRPPESMVACAHCGLNLPRSEAVEDAGRLYCSEAHRQLGQR